MATCVVDAVEVGACDRLIEQCIVLTEYHALPMDTIYLGIRVVALGQQRDRAARRKQTCEPLHLCAQPLKVGLRLGGGAPLQLQAVPVKRATAARPLSPVAPSNRWAGACCGGGSSLSALGMH